MMLTVRQHDTLAFIKAFDAANGVSPTFQEIAEGIGLRSKSGVHRLVSGLEERGFIRRLHYRERAIEIIPQDEPTAKMIDAGCAALKYFTFSEVFQQPGLVAAHVYKAMQKAKTQ